MPLCNVSVVLVVSLILSQSCMHLLDTSTADESFYVRTMCLACLCLLTNITSLIWSHRVWNTCDVTSSVRVLNAVLLSGISIHLRAVVLTYSRLASTTSY